MNPISKTKIKFWLFKILWYSIIFSAIIAAAHNIADANKLNELIADVDEELKYLDRQIIELKAVDYDITFIMMCQSSIHEEFKEKTKSLGIDIC